MKGLVRDYKEKADLTLIPHLKKQVEQLNAAYTKLAKQYEVLPKEAHSLEKEIGLVSALLDKEVTSLQSIMDNIYRVWEEIKKLREINNFASTTVKLNVRSYQRY